MSEIARQRKNRKLPRNKDPNPGKNPRFILLLDIFSKQLYFARTRCGGCMSFRIDSFRFFRRRIRSQHRHQRAHTFHSPRHFYSSIKTAPVDCENAVHSFSSFFLLLVVMMMLSPMLVSQEAGTWKEIGVPENSAFEFIDFGDSANGCLFTKQGLYTMTTDGGKTWSDQKSLEHCKKISKVSLIGPNICVAVDEVDDFPALPLSIVLHVTTDMGEHWIDRALPDSVIMFGGQTISLLCRELIGFVSDRSVLFTSTDLGGTWDTLSLNLNSISTFLHLFNVKHFMIGGGLGLTGSGFIKESTDGGATWLRFRRSGNSMNNSEFYTSTLGYIVGRDDYDENSWSTIYLYNPEIDSLLVPSAGGSIGALYDNGKYIPVGNWCKLTDSNWIYVEKFVTTGYRYSWILSDSGRVYQRTDLLTSVDNRRVDQHHNTAPFTALDIFPNPFNNSCTISASAGEHADHARVYIVDLLGRRVREIFDGRLSAGIHTFVWNGKNDQAIDVSSGTYYVVCVAPQATAAKRVVLLK